MKRIPLLLCTLLSSGSLLLGAELEGEQKPDELGVKLHKAIRELKDAVVEDLLQRGVMPNDFGDSIVPAFWQAIVCPVNTKNEAEKKDRIVSLLVNHPGVDLNTNSRDGWKQSVLHKLAEVGRIGCYDSYLAPKRQLDVNALSGGYRKATPLMVAIDSNPHFALHLYSSRVQDFDLLIEDAEGRTAVAILKSALDRSVGHHMWKR